MSEHKHTNKLIKASSPYLLQHAHNPVDWHPWGNEALGKAKTEDKPILVSIGYSACHWCHVMEHESFENEIIAALMNDNFINIKVDREERPDVDQVYMEAIQAMGINGGWPLNVFLTPDQKPFYGGTYFNPQQWAQILKGVADAYKNNRQKLEESADKFTESLAASEIEKYGLKPVESKFKPERLQEMFAAMARHFDKKMGGSMGAPKFPMPTTSMFLLRYYTATGNADALNQVELNLQKMAWGGIYDQIGGGFARYSVDDKWFLPHFEKMLYDNAQLLSLYAEAYSLTKNKEYKNVVEETVNWLKKEMTSPEGGFYSALDADSEGEEGKFYVWKALELKALLGNDYELICDYYNITGNGNWEHDNNIPFRSKTDEQFCATHNISGGEFHELVMRTKAILLKERNKRIRPGLDDKILLGWNAMTAKGLIDAYNAFGVDEFLKLAIANLKFIADKMQQGEQLFRNYKNGEANIEAYLKDYALYIDVLIAAYQATFEDAYINNAQKLTNYVLDHFYDKSEGMFFYTSNLGEKLIARKKEIYDNVIPSSNSIMANNLHWLGIMFDNEQYKSVSSEMLSRISNVIGNNTNYLSNWAILYFNKSTPTPEIVITGHDNKGIRKELAGHFIPNKAVMAPGSFPLTEGKETINGKPTIYVCFNKTCQLPVHSVDEALKQIKGE